MVVVRWWSLEKQRRGGSEGGCKMGQNWRGGFSLMILCSD